MKRSEMLHLITMEIPADEYWGVDYDAAERILKIIEEAGMLPPDCGFKGTTEHGVKVHYVAHIWEKE
jgi:hypothetical protein